MEDEVNQRNMKWFFVVLALAAMLAVTACKKKVAPAPPPPPPAPAAAPTASLTANPAMIEPGQSSTLSWTTQDATEVTLEGIGKVGPSGSQLVTPTTSTTYQLTAKGEGGSQDATARVTVIAPPPPTAAVPTPGDQELFARSVKDIYFDYDSYELTPADLSTLQADAAFLKSHSNMRFTVEGHCDERGSTEYNLALGENRANAVKQALVNLGVPAGSIKTISYGKERPVCSAHTEACWQQNRRGHFAFGQ
jgi:peptidoglycan-associated lipoprotein